MTVKELMDILEKLPPDSHVWTYEEEGLRYEYLVEPCVYQHDNNIKLVAPYGWGSDHLFLPHRSGNDWKKLT